MATLKRIIREIWRTPNQKPAMRDAFVRETCRLLLVSGAAGRASAFLAIEAIEAVRDKAAGICVAEMLRCLPKAPPSLVQGVFICIVEGYEERFAGEMQDVVPLFTLTPAKYVAGAEPNPLDRFGMAAARATRLHPRLRRNLEWANGRFSIWAA
jgi:hypothetical protein